MDYYVLTLFPEMIQQAAGASILGRAAKNGFIRVETVNIRDFSANKHMRVDDYPYGGGAGMVMEAEPVWRAVRSVEEKLGHRPRVVYLTPQGKVLDQTMVEEFAREEELVLLCGHYEGIDERVLEETVTDYVSIGDYVLTGGELGALVMIDAISRFVPGVLSNEESSQFESLQDNLLEYPHYTRPEIWHDRKVPEVLLSGDHKKIEEWRHQKSLERTELRRPDLLRKSYRVSCVYRGGPETAAAAELLTEKLSRYGTVLDFNRKKLRKQKREFHSRDLLVLVLQDPEEENDSESFRNLHGAGTPCVVVWLNEPEQERHKDLEIFLEKLYESKGIKEDTDFSGLKHTDYPVLSDLYHLAEQELNQYEERKGNIYTRETVRDLCLKLKSICIGADSKFFNGHTNITSNRFICFGTKGITDADTAIRNAMLFNVLSFMSDALLSKGNTAAFIDELYLFLTNMTAIEYIRNAMKRVRKKGSAVIIASQNIEDFNRADVREMTKPMFAIPTHQFLFNPGNISKKEYMEMLRLDECLFDLISNPLRGVCVFRHGSEVYHLVVKAPQYKEDLFGSAGGK